MQPEELRIGNYAVIHDADVDLIFQHQRIRITSIEKELIGTEYESIKGNIINAKEDIDLIHPIPLTEDRLIEFGFIMSPYYEGGKITITKQLYLEIRFYKDEIVSSLRYGDYVHQRHELNNIDYVHQLQNFYYDFKHKELEIQTIEA